MPKFCKHQKDTESLCLPKTNSIFPQTKFYFYPAAERLQKQRAMEMLLYIIIQFLLWKYNQAANNWYFLSSNGIEESHLPADKSNSH